MWNGGNEILEESDFYPNCELKITVSETEKILTAVVIEETDETCKVRVQNSIQNENEMLINFYCLEPQQGATITVYHTNIDENKTDLMGKIKGGKVLNRSIEMMIEDGEICMSTGNHKISFRSGLFRSYLRLLQLFPVVLGISIVKIKKNRKSK